MVLEAYMESDQQHQNQFPEEFVQFLNSVIVSQNEGSPTLGDLSPLGVQMPQQDTPLVIGNASINLQNNTTNSRSSTDESSMLTFADSPFSGGSNLPTNGSNSTDSRTSNCGKLSGPPTRDQFPALQQTSQEGQINPSWWARQGDQPTNPPFTPQLMIPAYQASVPLLNFKKPKLEMQQEDTLHVYPQQQLAPGQVPTQIDNYDPMASTKLYYQNLSRIQQQNQAPVPVAVPVPSPIRRQVQCLSPCQTPVTVQKPLVGIPVMNGILCHLRLMHYMIDQRNRPADNNIGYWRKFVDHYFSVGVRKRWCLSNYHNVGCHAHNIFSQTAADSWKCEFCGSKLEKGFVATHAVLPRLSQVYFESVVDELLYIDLPAEKTLPSGCIVLWFGKAVQESVYKHFRVVHEGQLRIVFTPELKILSWDFCVKRHEVLLVHRSIITQVNYMVEEVAKLQNNSEGVSTQYVLSNCSRVMANLVTNMIPLIVDEVGFPKRFVRHFQISDTLHCMKSLMAESRAKNLSPMEALRSYSQETAEAKPKHVEGGAQMHGISSPDSNLQATNILTQTPLNAGLQQAVLSPPVYYPNQPIVGEQRMALNSMSPMKSVLGPSTSQQLPTVGCQINDLLARIRAQGTGTRKCTIKASRGKRRLVYDPKSIEHSQCVEFADKVKSKGFNYSSSSNSSVMDFADKSILKREPDSDDDSTSPACFQGIQNLRSSS